MLRTLVCKCCKQEFQVKKQNSLGFCRECSTTLKEYTCSVCGKDFKTKPKLVFQKGKPVCRICVSKANCKAKYGVESPMQLQEIASKAAATRSANFDSESFKEKLKTTKIKNYGSLENERLSRLLKRKETNLKKYGVEFPQQLESVKEKQKQTLETKLGEDWKKKMFSKSRKTCKERYGFENVFSSPDFQEKIKQTNLKKYGVPNPRRNKDVASKVKTTNELRYGGTGFGAPALRYKYKRKYEYDNLIFDSQWELAFYIYHKDHNANIQKEPCFFEYTFNGETYKYYPDFSVNGELVELKGGQFIAEKGNWQNPYDHSQDDRYEAKHQCALAHNVKIITDAEEYIKYVESKYTLDYLKLFNTTLAFPYLNEGLKDQTDLGLIQHFHKSIYEASKKGKPSPLQGWQDKNLIKAVALNRLKYVKSCRPSDILQGFSVTRKAPKISVFKPKLATELIQRYLTDFSEIVDPFSGFSGRLIGAANCSKVYIGKDINEKHVGESNEIIQYKNYQNCFVVIEDLLKKTDIETHECLFTCPPYGGKEHWNENNDEIEKSCDEWIDLCLQHYICKRYLFVVDKTEKYKGNVVENIQHKNGLFSNKHEYIILIDREEK